jgi:hypothetical protein
MTLKPAMRIAVLHYEKEERERGRGPDESYNVMNVPETTQSTLFRNGPKNSEPTETQSSIEIPVPPGPKSELTSLNKAYILVIYSKGSPDESTCAD